MNEPVRVKWSGNGLELWMNSELSYSELREALIKRLDENASFYISSKKPVVIFGKIFNEPQKRELKSLLYSGYFFDKVSFVDDADEQPIKKAEVPTPQAQPEEKTSEPINLDETVCADKKNAEPENMFICHTVRSGQRIRCSGNITVLGDVNAGAELIAGGNIAVFGRLSGTVHAGSNGDTSAVIAATRLSAGQIRICGKIAIMPPKHKAEYPEIARLTDDKIVITNII